jgi:putative aldouronate transport system substrate-binding protein
MGQGRTLRIVMAAILLLAVILPAAAAGATGTRASGQVRVLSAVTGGKTEAEDALFAAALAKATGLDIVWERVASGYDQVLLQKLGAGERYDLLYMTQFMMYTLANQGALSDLTARIAKSQVYKDNVPQAELEKIALSGRYYAGFNKLEVFPLPNVNKAITDKAGVDISRLETLDQYLQMLRTVKAYMQTTGGVNPYYPFFTYMPDIWDLQPWFSSAGVRRGVFVGANGKKTAPYLDARAQPVWEWLAGLYAEGLMDPASFTGKTGDMRSKMWQSQGIVLDVDWAAWTGLYNNNARLAGTYPQTVNVVGLPGTRGPDGKFLLEQGGASLWTIPANAKNPDAAFAVIEYFATKEGGLLLSAGIEGNDYVVKNGRLEFTEDGVKHAKDHGAPFPISRNFDMSVLGTMNAGALDSVAIGKRADVSVAPMGYANGALDARAYYDVMSKWMTECVMGRLSAADAIRNAANELRGKDYRLTDGGRGKAYAAFPASLTAWLGYGRRLFHGRAAHHAHLLPARRGSLRADPHRNARGRGQTGDQLLIPPGCGRGEEHRGHRPAGRGGYGTGLVGLRAQEDPRFLLHRHAWLVQDTRLPRRRHCGAVRHEEARASRRRFPPAHHPQ